ncbi:LytTR family DNA-binding domain-containing protein [Cytophagaceae bacterium DM2B3-1]|uniref:LytTR family DNA-binding domain-containing protein n=1 Tax=Xanthocytophaga flava TaxID=3048013 RepID=A0ABT7CV33_9BACT|nr:LytTR family DNA-binding domain-containing protein [Xanthocytophaga flavus]MDJ1496790.1 LytTR family DNA-binding domain-containing protein [Xanthocytophaga flavus]
MLANSHPVPSNIISRNCLGIIAILLSLSAGLAYIFQVKIGDICTVRTFVTWLSGMIFWTLAIPFLSKQTQHYFSKQFLWVKSLLAGLVVCIINQIFVRFSINAFLCLVFGCTDNQTSWTFNVLQNNILINFICYWCIVGLTYMSLQFQLSYDTTSSINFQSEESHSENISFITTVSVKNGSVTTHIPTQKIFWIESDNNTVTFVSELGKFVNYQSLRSLETQLDPVDFQRIHRSIIVNRKYVHKIQAQSSGDALVTLTTGDQLRMSRRYKTISPNTL